MKNQLARKALCVGICMALMLPEIALAQSAPNSVIHYAANKGLNDVSSANEIPQHLSKKDQRDVMRERIRTDRADHMAARSSKPTKSNDDNFVALVAIQTPEPPSLNNAGGALQSQLSAKIKSQAQAEIDAENRAIKLRQDSERIQHQMDRLAENASLKAKKEADAKEALRLENERKALEIKKRKAEEEAARKKAEKDRADAIAEKKRFLLEELARDKAEVEFKAKLAQQLKANIEAEKKAAEEVETIKKEKERTAQALKRVQEEEARKAEALRLQKIEQERKAEIARQAKLEAERKAKLEAERKAEEIRLARAAAERKVKLEAERKAEEIRLARAEADRQAKLLAEAELQERMEKERQEQARIKAEYEQKIEAERQAKFEQALRIKEEAERLKVERLRQQEEAKQAKIEQALKLKADKQKAILEAQSESQRQKEAAIQIRAKANSEPVGFNALQNIMSVDAIEPSEKSPYVARGSQSALQVATSKIAGVYQSPLRAQYLGYTATESQLSELNERTKYNAKRLSVLPRSVGEIKLLPVIKLSGDTVLMYRTLQDKKTVEEFMSYYPLHAQVYGNYVKRVLTLRNGNTGEASIDRAIMEELTYDISVAQVPSSSLSNAQDAYLYFSSRLSDDDQVKFWNWINAVKQNGEVKVPSWIRLGDVIYSQ